MPSKFSKDYLKSLGIVDLAYTQEGQALSFSRFSQWVEKGSHLPLTYLEGERKTKRRDLKQVFPSFESALVFLFSYADYKRTLLKYFKRPGRPNFFRMAAFALSFGGEDYHKVLKGRLEELAREMEILVPGIKIFHSLDIQPVLERDLAYRSGLGWFGKNSMLISRKHGSYTMLGSLFFSRPLPPEILSQIFPEERVGSEKSWWRPQETDHCGQCTACIEACPTQAISKDGRTLHADKCLSTFTIEVFKDHSPPPSGWEKGQGEIFGCDICQEVCPWNRKLMKESPGERDLVEELGLKKFPKLATIFDFFLERPPQEIVQLLQSMSGRQFKKYFQGTSLERTGRLGLLKNILPFSFHRTGIPPRRPD